MALIKDLEERLEALTIALPKEESAHRFYLRLAKKTEHEGARKIFLQLADEELDHKHHLEKMVEDIRQKIAGLKAGDK